MRPRKVPTAEALQRFGVGMTNKDKKPLYLRAMARQLGVPATWLRTEAEAGRIPHLRAGSVLLFDPEMVQQTLFDRLREVHMPAKGVDRAK